MTENPKQGNMSSDYLMSKESGKNPDDDDSFVLDIRGIYEKDINANSRLITRNLLRKESSSNRGVEKKSNQGKAASTPETYSPAATATLQGDSTPEHTGIVGMGSIDQVHRHHHITINNASSATAESKRGVKRFDFKHSSRTWAIDPRRILLFFATLSSMGTIILIYFTLSMGKLNMDDNLN